MLTAYRRHVLASWLTPHNLAARIGHRTAQRRAGAYLAREGALEVLTTGNEAEKPPHLVDLAHLYGLIRKRRPTVVLEFGVGFSTIAIAHALARNAAEGRRPDRGHVQPIERPQVWSVDASAEWLDNTRKKMPPGLERHVDLRLSPVRSTQINGQLCSLYDELPNIVPDFIYLDAPAAADIQGTVRGLSFSPETGGYRHQAAADVLLLESTLQVGAFILLDSRYVNAHFLVHNLSRRYRVRWNHVHGWVTFELLEWTGRSRDPRSADAKKR